MGKIKITGTAKREYESDVMEIRFETSLTENTQQSAARNGRAETEKLLKALKRAGCDIAAITLEEEKITEKTEYNNNSVKYRYSKAMKLEAKADARVSDKIASIISGDPMKAVYSVSFMLSDESSREDEVLRAALADSKRKAELIAEEMGQKITGIESAELDGFPEAKTMRAAVCDCSAENASLASELSPAKKIIEKTIEATWIIE